MSCHNCIFGDIAFLLWVVVFIGFIGWEFYEIGRLTGKAKKKKKRK